MKIFGVEILNEGSGISIDDSVSETQASFVARYVEPWQVVKTKFPVLTRCLRSLRLLPHARARERIPPARRTSLS